MGLVVLGGAVGCAGSATLAGAGSGMAGVLGTVTTGEGIGELSMGTELVVIGFAAIGCRGVRGADGGTGVGVGTVGTTPAADVEATDELKLGSGAVGVTMLGSDAGGLVDNGCSGATENGAAIGC